MVNIIILLLIVLGLSVICDIKYQKIPNKLVLFGFFIGIIHLCIYDSPKNILIKIPIILFIILSFYPLFKIGVIGAGDIKLYGILPLFFSNISSIKIILLSILLSAILALFKMLYLHIIVSRFQYFHSYLQLCFTNQKVYPYYFNENKTKNSTIPLTASIFIICIIKIGRIYL